MAIYLDETQRAALAGMAQSRTWRSQWPTWLLIATIYGGWFGTATHARELGLPLTTLLLVLFSTWYMSLQHELLHGHPTRSARLNASFGFAPLAVWFPYGAYRDSHLQHHDDPHLTHPERDPESYFVAHVTWIRAGAPIRALLTFRNTFIGRMLVGPAFAIAATHVAALARIRRGDWRDVPMWLAHFAALAALTLWLQQSCAFPAWLFIVGVGYGALSLSSVRSFQEHRAAHEHAHRTVVNEAAWIWRLLFLNNNYHAVHHDLPHVPWFALKRVYEARREAYLERNGGFLVKGYREWLTRYALSAVGSCVHPQSEHAADNGKGSGVDSRPRFSPLPWTGNGRRLERSTIAADFQTRAERQR
ncbi:fatty acid desaturase [Paraburkholderia sp. GAS199]|uniref:fatty acid desaturase n=1 Tax=Paraburkholderia sp. GAS199 TaxID=3035126 RepID=UPI003D1A7C87